MYYHCDNCETDGFGDNLICCNCNIKYKDEIQKEYIIKFRKRSYFDIPIEKKNEAKSIGAEFDWNSHMWFSPTKKIKKELKQHNFICNGELEWDTYFKKHKKDSFNSNKSSGNSFNFDINARELAEESLFSFDEWFG